MDGRLFFAQQLAQGLEVPEGTHSIDLSSHEITFRAETQREMNDGWRGQPYMTDWISSEEFENEQVGYETYTISFDSWGNFTLEQFNDWKEANPNAIENMKENQKAVASRLAELSEVINKALAEGERLADDVGLPFMVKLGGSYQDVRKLAAVDWHSSSMYC